VGKGILFSVPKIIASIQSQYGLIFERHLMNSLRLQILLEKITCYYPIEVVSSNMELSFLLCYERPSEQELTELQYKSEGSRKVTTMKSLKSEPADDMQTSRKFQKRYLQVKQLYSNIDGMLRIVNLVKSKLVPEIVCLVGQNLLRILEECHQHGLTGVVHRDNLLIDTEGQFKVQTFIPHCQLDESGLLLDGIELYLSHMYECLHGDNFKTVVYDMTNKYESDPYIAPELRLKKGIANSSLYQDIWMFGMHLYELLFGQSALRLLKFPSRTEEFPKDFKFELYSKEVFNDILKNCFSVEYEGEYLAEGIDRKSFVHAFIKQIISDEEGVQDVCDILDLIALCLEPEYYNRPTLKSLLNSKIFRRPSSDSRQLSSIIFMYETPS
jgi:serine/threonine protein kinase